MNTNNFYLISLNLWYLNFLELFWDCWKSESTRAKRSFVYDGLWIVLNNFPLITHSCFYCFLKFFHGFAPNIGINFLYHISFDWYIKLIFFFIYFKSKDPSAICNLTKDNSLFEEAGCRRQSDMWVWSPIKWSILSCIFKKVNSNECPNSYGAYFPNTYSTLRKFNVWDCNCYIIVLLNQIVLNNFLKNPGMLKGISEFLVGKNWTLFLDNYSCLSLISNYQVICWILIFSLSISSMKRWQLRIQMYLGWDILEMLQ